MVRWLGRLTNAAFYLCLLAAGYCVLHVFAVVSFRIPSDSMSPALLPGDYILVDKCSGGARLFDLSGALEGKDVEIYRVPGWRRYRRDDVLVFNFPYRPGSWDSIAFDVMRYYVKRCVAVPGDTLEIRNGRYRIAGHEGNVGYLPSQEAMALLPDSGAAGVQMETFPWNKDWGWTVKEFGPLPVPAKGQVVEMDSVSWLLYRQPVGWEQKKEIAHGCGRPRLSGRQPDTGIPLPGELLLRGGRQGGELAGLPLLGGCFPSLLSWDVR